VIDDRGDEGHRLGPEVAPAVLPLVVLLGEDHPDEPAEAGPVGSSEKITLGPVGIGTQYRQTRSVPRQVVEVIEITGLQHGRRVDVGGTLGPFRARLAYELEVSPTGTRLTNTVELDPPVPLGPFGAVLSSRVRTSVAENLRVLKQLIEGLGSPAQGG